MQFSKNLIPSLNHMKIMVQSLNWEEDKNLKFKSLQEALKYMAYQAKTYPSEIDYYSSEDYKKIYPELCRLNRLMQAARAVHH